MGKDLCMELEAAFVEKGKKIAVCGAERAIELRAIIEEGRASGSIHSGLEAEYFSGMRFGAELARPASILIIASPHERALLCLDLPDGIIEASIPATYLAERIRASNEALLASVLGAEGFSFEKAALPLKSLAARAGLGKYGRDSVIRVEGMGSYARLDAYWTDAELGEGRWGAPRALERCASCRACARACPNGCIGDESFRIDTARCLTFLNEGGPAFPSWLAPSAHNAAIGCLRCQEACPENLRAKKGFERRIDLDRASSSGLLAGKGVAELGERAADLVRLLGLEGMEDRLARNLAALRVGS